nr:alpha,alpha-trehalose-phosphate synthase [UDP-forming] 1 [Tanacetum cinerariifolium]
MIVVPSRDQVPQYAALKEEIDELVGRINSQYGSISWNPVLYFYRSFPFEELAAFYHLADVALVTPVRDGMSLVAKEFIASKTGSRLSDAILINPTDTNQLVAAMHEALQMPHDE